MKNKFKLILALLSLTISASHAAVSPIGISLTPQAEFPPRDFNVMGARLGVFWSEHKHVYGIDLGILGNTTTQQFGGIAVSGLFNLNKGNSTIIGLQAAGGTNVNVNKARIYGLQLAGFLNSNQAESFVLGFQVAGIANYSPFTKVVGIQVAPYNKAKDVYGFQIGIINYADTLHGIQIGLLNFHKQGIFAVSPGINIGF